MIRNKVVWIIESCTVSGKMFMESNTFNTNNKNENFEGCLPKKTVGNVYVMLAHCYKQHKKVHT